VREGGERRGKGRGGERKAVGIWGEVAPWALGDGRLCLQHCHPRGKAAGLDCFTVEHCHPSLSALPTLQVCPSLFAMI